MKIIRASTGEEIQVSDSDYPKLAKQVWHINDHGYPYFIWYSGRRSNKFTMHTEVLPSKKGFVVDHIDNDRLNCQRENLRYLTHAQNARNRRKFAGASKYKGVVKMPDGKYRAQITHKYRQFIIGRFPKEIWAALAYDIWARKLDPFYKTNFDEKHPTLAEVQAMLDENGRYRPNLGRSGESAIRGVKYDKSADIYVAVIGYAGQKHKLGKRKIKAEAGVLYDTAARILYGTDAQLNFPEAKPVPDIITKANAILARYPDYQRREYSEIPDNGKSYHGVYRNGKRFGARIYVDKKLVILGNRDTREEAARLYDAEAVRLGRRRNLNFPEEHGIARPKNVKRRKDVRKSTT